MCKAQNVADFFVDSALEDPDDNMTNMRVNKLLYFAQGWSLSQRDVPLFKEEIYAWKYGPVVPEIYHAFKSYERTKIQNVTDDNYASNFSTEESLLLVDVLREYKKYSTNGLVDLSHRKGTPWYAVFPKHPGEIISKSLIRSYFKALPPLRKFRLPEIHDEDIVGYRNEAGTYVLPRSWKDD